MLFYRATLPLSPKTLTYIASIIRRHRKKIGSCWRKLNPGRQALLVLAYLRKGDTFAELAAGFDIGTATAWRYVSETVALLAAPRPEAAPRAGQREESRARLRGNRWHLNPHRPRRADRPFYSGKHRRHGMNLQVISAPDGEIRWVSPAARRRPRPDRSEDLGHHPPAGSRRAHRAGRQGLPRCRGPRPYSLPRQEQARLAKGRQPRPCPATVPRRARQRPAQELAHPAQTPLLPVEGRAAGQSHPRPSSPRDRRMKKTHCARRYVPSARP